MNNKTYLALSLLVSLPLVASEQEQSSSQEKQEIDLKERGAQQGTLQRSSAFVQLAEELVFAAEHAEKSLQTFHAAKGYMMDLQHAFSGKSLAKGIAFKKLSSRNTELAQQLKENSKTDNQQALLSEQEENTKQILIIKNELAKVGELAQQYNTIVARIQSATNPVVTSSQSTSVTTKESHE